MLLKIFDFADTARVLLWNVNVATYFLFDEWYTNDHEKRRMIYPIAYRFECFLVYPQQ